MKNKGIWIGLGVAALGAAAFFIFRRKKKPLKEEPPKETPKEEPPKKRTASIVLGDIDTKPSSSQSATFLKKRFLLSDKGLSKDDSKVLKFGQKDNDVRLLQNYLNVVAQDKIKAGQSYYEPQKGVSGFELKTDGNFDSDTEQALGWYTGKTTITLKDLKKAIAARVAINYFSLGLF